MITEGQLSWKDIVVLTLNGSGFDIVSAIDEASQE